MYKRLSAKNIIMFGLLLLVGVMVAAPQEVVAGAAAGLSLWALCVLPALLPFFIVSDLLTELGAVDFLGALCEPLMRPVFRLPGCAAFVLAVVHTAGMPIGAALTSRLRESGQLSRIEGERLLAFSCNPSPGFMFGAVAGGMLGVPALGAVLAGSVYAANLIVGFVFRFYGGRDKGGARGEKSAREGFSARAAHGMRAVQLKRRSFGEILAASIKKNVAVLLQIGGYMVFFSVIIRMLKTMTVLALISHIPAKIAGLWGAGAQMPESGLVLGTGAELGMEAVLTGLIEQTLGCRAVVDAMPTMAAQVGAIAFLMGFGGLCVFAQVSGFAAETDLRLRPFLAARLLHGSLALALSQVALRHLHLSVMVPSESVAYLSSHQYTVQFWHVFRWNLLFFGVVMVMLVFFWSRARLRRVSRD
ncbi:MAG: sporulation integral membrane protein YlbJ [Peptococcaceae bacterium]|nr:sporulation integral membrane protein YlbJ [Peptococcaceae bacterium]